MKITEYCEYYFEPFVSIDHYKAMDHADRAKAIAKIISYIFILPPLIMGIVYGVSALVNRISKKETLDDVDEATKSIAADVLNKEPGGSASAEPVDEKDDLSSAITGSYSQTSSEQIAQLTAGISPPEDLKDLAQPINIEVNQAEEELVRKYKQKLANFFQILNNNDIKRADSFIDKFNITTKFPDLWCFADNSPFEKIPFADFPAELVNQNVPGTQWESFINDIDKSIETIAKLSSSLNDNAHSSLKLACEKILNRLGEIKDQAATISKQGTVLKYNQLPSLKLDNQLRFELKIQLEEIERIDLLEFYAHLAYLTLNGSKNSALITKGLNKLRDYTTNRSLRLKKVMDAGQTGVASFIYENCLKTLFSTQVLSEIEPFLKRMKQGKLIEVAYPRNLGGYHFVCFVQTDKGIYELDSMGTKKTRKKEFPDHSSLVYVGDKFYRSCKPLPIDKISVPQQQNNNCYLAAGWLTFSTFLYFYNQSIR